MQGGEGGAVLHGREMDVLTSIAWEKYCMGGVLHGKSIAWEGDGSVRTFRPRAALPPSFPQRQHASSFQRIAPLFKTKMDRLGINWEGQTLIGIVSVLHQDEGGIGKSIHDALQISLDPQDRVSGNLSGVGDDSQSIHFSFEEWRYSLKT